MSSKQQGEFEDLGEEGADIGSPHGNFVSVFNGACSSIDKQESEEVTGITSQYCHSMPSTDLEVPSVKMR